MPLLAIFGWAPRTKDKSLVKSGIYHGFTMIIMINHLGEKWDLPWIYHGFTMIYHGFTMDLPWIYPSLSPSIGFHHLVGAISSAAHKRSKKRGIRWRCQFDGIHT
jgi:hypothetical protein